MIVEYEEWMFSNTFHQQLEPIQETPTEIFEAGGTFPFA